MNKLEEQLSLYKKVDIWKITQKVMVDQKDQIIQLVRDQQRRGEKKSGAMPEYKSDAYIGYKASINRLTAGNRVNLYDEGNFQAELDAAIKSNFVEIFSTDEKADELEDIYSKEIYELNEDGMVAMKSFLLPLVMVEIRIQLNY